MMKTTASHQQGKQSAAGAPPAQTFRAEPPRRPPQTVTQNVRPPRVDEDFDDDLKKLYGADEKRPMPAPRHHKKPDLPPATIRVVGRPPVKAADSRDERAPAGLAMTVGAKTDSGKARDERPPAGLAKTEQPVTIKSAASVPEQKISHEHLHYHVHTNLPADQIKLEGAEMEKELPKASFNPFGDDDNPPIKSGLKDLAPGEEVSFSKDDK